ncbi:MAG TPA: hypothetical protein VLE23_02920 [Geminicoccaceae bacterium]|nr:hypothetical protein [Geminicoccaceae bacterium]
MPSGPGPIDDARIAAIAARVPPPVATFLLTSETGAEAIIAHAKRCRTNTLQLVDSVEPADYPRLRAVPGIRLRSGRCGPSGSTYAPACVRADYALDPIELEAFVAAVLAVP